MRTFTTRKGLIINTDLDDEQALRVCATLTNSTFARDLVYSSRTKGLTQEQLAWAHKLALEATGRSDQISTDSKKVEGFSNLNALFVRALQTIAAPSMKLLMKRGTDPHQGARGDVYLHLGIQPGVAAGSGNETNPHQIKVMIGPHDSSWGNPHYVGRIDRHGVLYEGGACTGEITSYLWNLGNHPSLVLGNSGRLSGVCPMCGQTNSGVAAEVNGYGHVCARTWGLDWMEPDAK